MLWGKKKPMSGTLRPKGSYEERNRAVYVENKQAKLEEALRIVQLRNTVLPYLRPQLTTLWPLLDSWVLTFLVAGVAEDQGKETKAAIRFHRKTIPTKIDPHSIEGAWQCTYIYISFGDCTNPERVESSERQPGSIRDTSRTAIQASNRLNLHFTSKPAEPPHPSLIALNPGHACVSRLDRLSRQDALTGLESAENNKSKDHVTMGLLEMPSEWIVPKKVRASIQTILSYQRGFDDGLLEGALIVQSRECCVKCVFLSLWVNLIRFRNGSRKK
jgi:hypothetical protein